VEDIPLEVSLASLQLLCHALGKGGCMSGFSFQSEGLCSDFFFPISQQHLAGHGLLIVEASLSNSDTSQSVGPLWRVISPTQKFLPDKTHNTHKRRTSMTPAEFELAVPASEGPQTHALDSAATGIGLCGESALKDTATASTCFPIQHSAPSRRVV
jgi:hypothetical protein